MENSNSNEGFVSALYISREKGQPRDRISQGFFREDHGLEGDAWSGPGDRQVVILSKKARLSVEDDIRNGLCYPRFKETLQICGVLMNQLVEGSRLEIGDVLLEISRIGKSCFSECEIVQSGSICAMKKNALFARVLKEGIISEGDSVTLRD